MEIKPSIFIPKSHRELVDREYTIRTTHNYQTAALLLQSTLNLSDAELKRFHENSIFLNDDHYNRLSRAQVVENFHPKARRQMFAETMQTGLAANILFNSDTQKQAALALLGKIDPATAESLDGLQNTKKLVIFHLSDLVRPDPTRLATFMAHEHYHFDSTTKPATTWDALDIKAMADVEKEYPEVDSSDVTRISDGFRSHFFDNSTVLQLSGYHTDDSLAMVTHAQVAAKMTGHSLEAHLEALYEAGFVQSSFRSNLMPLREPLLIDAMLKTFGSNLDRATHIAKEGNRRAVYDLAQKGVPVEQVVDFVESGDMKNLEATLWHEKYLSERLHSLTDKL